MATRPGSRPQSSLSYRPLSRVSSRPLSRISNRTALSRHAARVVQLAHVLVSQAGGMTLDDNPDAFAVAYERTLRALEAKKITSETLETTDVRIQRLAKKARINIQDNLAEALLQAWTCMKQIAADDFQDEDEIRLSNLPEQMQFLLELASPPAPSTLAHADIVLSGEREIRNKSSKLTWGQIMAEEPFEGEHWEAIFPKASSKQVLRDDDISSLSEPESLDGKASRSSLSDKTVESLSSPEASDIFLEERSVAPRANCIQPSSLWSREAVEKLRERQYWTSEWRSDSRWDRPFNIADPSTLAATVDRVSGSRWPGRSSTPKVIDEADVVLDVMLLLQGIDSPLMVFLEDDFGDKTQATIVSDPPRVMHLSIEAYRSILTEFCFAATRLQEFRYLIRSIYAIRTTQTQRSRTSYRPPTARTLEAFAEAIDASIRHIDAWCSTQEQNIVLSRNGAGHPTVATLLSSCHAMQTKMTSALEVIQDILRQILRSELIADPNTHQRAIEKVGFLRANVFSSIPPNVLSTRLLESLSQAIYTQIAIGDVPTASFLTEIFIMSAEPLWVTVRSWLQNGIPVAAQQGIEEDETEELDPEFFIYKREADLLSPDFWERGYAFRLEGGGQDGDESRSVPSNPTLIPGLFSLVAADILSTGKAVGLLRALGIHMPFLQDESGEWKSLAQLYMQCRNEAAPLLDEDASSVVGDAVYDLRQTLESLPIAVMDHITSWAKGAREKLNWLLHEECAMMDHLHCIENFFFMRKGDIMSTFCDQIFAKLDAQQKWHDLHFLNSTLRRVTDRNRPKWIETGLIRFYMRGGRERNNANTVRCFDGLIVEYDVPFPLTYLLCRTSAAVYSSVFVFIMQIRRAKTIIDNTILRGALVTGFGVAAADIHLLYALRSRLAWFINSLMAFITSHVIEGRVKRLHESLSKAYSLDEMITIHDKHLAHVQALCFLQTKTAALHRALLSILDLAIQFGHFYASYAAENLSDDFKSDPTYTETRRRKRKRKRGLHAKNRIGFTGDGDSSSDASSSFDDEILNEEHLAIGGDQEVERPSLTAAVSFTEDSFVVKVDRLSEELEGQVRYVKKAMDVLGGGSSETASTFGIFSFMLEEWSV